MENPIRHVGKDRLAEGESEDAVSAAKSELEAEEKLLEDLTKKEPGS